MPSAGRCICNHRVLWAGYAVRVVSPVERRGNRPPSLLVESRGLRPQSLTSDPVVADAPPAAPAASMPVPTAPVASGGVAPNGNLDVGPATVGDDVYTPGSADGLQVERRAQIIPSPWAGWPAEWTPQWSNGAVGGRLESMLDTVWGCTDLNARVLATMPIYATKNESVVESPVWMENPDPDRYTSWAEFAKQMFWDFQHGEAFVLVTARYADGYPARFHIAEPWMVNCEIRNGLREYRIGSLDVTDDILHLRYKSTVSNARGVGPLESANLRVTAAVVLARYATELARQGGVPHTVLRHPGRLSAAQADDLVHQWWDARTTHLGLPAVVSGGLEVDTLQVNPKDMALLELSQFNEARLAWLLGVPPFLAALPGGGDSMTYSNVQSVFDFHWRGGLSTMAVPVMQALSLWALPRGTRCELNRDEYVRGDLTTRASAYSTLHGIIDADGTSALSAGEVRRMERFGEATTALTGGITS